MGSDNVVNLQDIGEVNSYLGKLIVYEGIDGSGKSSISYEMCKVLNKVHKSIILAEPTKEGLKSVDDFVNDRRYNRDNFILPYLKKGYIVHLDRYFYSNIAYQSIEEDDIDTIIEKNKEVSIKPDMTIFFEIPVKISLKRVSDRENSRYMFFENEVFLNKVEEVYRKMNADNIHRVYANKPLDEVENDCFNLIKDILRLKNLEKMS